MNTGFRSGAGNEISFSRDFNGPKLNTKVWAEGRWGSKKDDQKSEKNLLPCLTGPHSFFLAHYRSDGTNYR